MRCSYQGLLPSRTPRRRGGRRRHDSWRGKVHTTRRRRVWSVGRIFVKATKHCPTLVDDELCALSHLSPSSTARRSAGKESLVRSAILNSPDANPQRTTTWEPSLSIFPRSTLVVDELCAVSSLLHDEVFCWGGVPGMNTSSGCPFDQRLHPPCPTPDGVCSCGGSASLGVCSSDGLPWTSADACRSKYRGKSSLFVRNLSALITIQPTRSLTVHPCLRRQNTDAHIRHITAMSSHSPSSSSSARTHPLFYHLGATNSHLPTDPTSTSPSHPPLFGVLPPATCAPSNTTYISYAHSCPSMPKPTPSAAAHAAASQTHWFATSHLADALGSWSCCG